MKLRTNAVIRRGTQGVRGSVLVAQDAGNVFPPIIFVTWRNGEHDTFSEHFVESLIEAGLWTVCYNPKEGK